MKKVILMVAFIAATVAANAQFYIGGGFQLNSSKPVHAEDADVDATTRFSLIPEIGYNIDDKWTIGLGIGYKHISNFTLTVDDYKLGFDKMNGFTIQPYVRYNFVKWNNVSLFAQGGLGYTYAKGTVEGERRSDDFDATIGTFYIGFMPGVKVDLSKKLSLIATIGNLGWETTSVGGDIDGIDPSSTFDLNVDLSQINFAMYYNF